MADDYICKIGIATENTAKLALFHFLWREYQRAGHDEEFAGGLAGCVTDKVFGEELHGGPKIGFAKHNGELIESHASEIAKNEGLCRILTGAVYNICYARYLNAGGKRTMFSNPFLAYIRAGRDLTSRTNRHIDIDMYSEIVALGPHILAPMEAMRALKIFRTLPYSPNERAFYDAVCQFGRQAGVQ